MRIIATLFAAMLVMAGCATPSVVSNQPIHQVSADTVADKTLTFSHGSGDVFTITPTASGAMTFRDVAVPKGGARKGGSGEWQIRDGKLWVKSNVYWRSGTNWTFYGPAADGSYLAVNAKDSQHTQYRVEIH